VIGLIKKDVLWLDVSVNNCWVSRMEIGNCLEDFFDHLFCCLLIKFPFSAYLGKELTVLSKLKDQIDILSIIEGVVQFNYVRMVKLPRYFDFIV